MNTPAQHFLDCPHPGKQPGSHRMAYYRFGAADHPHVVVCVHGISRQARDFDELAAHLLGADGNLCQVISVDVVGRGASDWLLDENLYQVPQYAADLIALLAQLKGAGAQTIDWVGTSMGGLIGMAVGAQLALNPALAALKIRKMLINDVGPVIEWSSIERIKQNFGKDPHFKSQDEAVAYMWNISSSFGPHSPEAWRALCLPQMKAVSAQEGGGFKLHYDPRIALPFRASSREDALAGEALLWQAYDAIQSEVLLVRGAESDLLSPDTAKTMTERGPKAKLIEFAGVGHAPTFVALDQKQAVERFLFG